MTPIPTQAEDLVLREKIADAVRDAVNEALEAASVPVRVNWRAPITLAKADVILAMISAVPSRDQAEYSSSLADRESSALPAHPISGGQAGWGFPFNVNDTVKVKLTDAGLAVLREQHEMLHLNIPSIGAFKAPALDATGWASFQLWSLMQAFGPHITMGRPVPFETTILIPSSIAQPIGAAGEAEAKGSAPDEPPSDLPSDGVEELIERLTADADGIEMTADERNFPAHFLDRAQAYEANARQAAATLSRLRPRPPKDRV